MIKPYSLAICKNSIYSYPNKEEKFRPSMDYPEYPFKGDIAKQKNDIYEMVRETFHLLHMDESNYNLCTWNPLGDLITPGNTVLIKPNLVMDRNVDPNLGTDCLYTQPSVIAPVIDYIIIALQGKGKIIIGDAPMQECDFDNLVQTSGLMLLVDYYRAKGINIELVDFRGLRSTIVNGIYHSTVDPSKKDEGVVVNLGNASEFADFKGDYTKMRVTNYDPRILCQHHNERRHEYYISKYILNSDVIINMPKPKSHRKAGVTISLKNLVGANVRKEYLPHHTKGSLASGGDEYLSSNPIHALRSIVIDRRNIFQYERKYFRAKLMKYVSLMLSMILKLQNNKYSEGSWYGNDTISRTIMDLNRIVMYCDKSGFMQTTKQRKYFIVADMIISGEKEGPVSPSPKNVGIIAAGYDPVIFDNAIATLMGFDIKKIPSLIRANSDNKGPYKIYTTKDKATISSNNDHLDGADVTSIPMSEVLWFKPTSGWAGHIEIDRS